MAAPASIGPDSIGLDFPPPTLDLRVDGEALAANWRALDRLCGAAQTGAAVKADGYGLGIDPVVAALTGAGAREFFVAHWGEAKALLAHVPAEAISVLHGPVTEREAAFGGASGISTVINSLEQAQRWLAAGGGPCRLMVDTGMSRLGIAMTELGDPLVRRLEVAVLMSHLASADEDSALNALQLARFREAAAIIPAQRRSLANSAGIALGRDYHFDLTRPGIALYGGVPRAELSGVIRQVVHLRAAVLQVRALSAGDIVGYNATFTAPRPMRAATISLGYADGFLRAWSGKGVLRFEGADLPLLGRVSMDMVIADASALPQLREGDLVEIPYSLPEASRVSGISQYELLTGLGDRFKRLSG